MLPQRRCQKACEKHIVTDFCELFSKSTALLFRYQSYRPSNQWGTQGLLGYRRPQTNIHYQPKFGPTFNKIVINKEAGEAPSPPAEEAKTEIEIEKVEKVVEKVENVQNVAVVSKSVSISTTEVTTEAASSTTAVNEDNE